MLRLRQHKNFRLFAQLKLKNELRSAFYTFFLKMFFIEDECFKDECFPYRDFQIRSTISCQLPPGTTGTFP